MAPAKQSEQNHVLEQSQPELPPSELQLQQPQKPTLLKSQSDLPHKSAELDGLQTDTAEIDLEAQLGLMQEESAEQAKEEDKQLQQQPQAQQQPEQLPVQQQKKQRPANAPDVIFIGHPAYLTDVPALFAKPSQTDRWHASWWMNLLLPIFWLISYWSAHIKPRLFGVSHMVVDDVVYNGIRVQTWIVTHFGRHFRNDWERSEAKRNVELAALAAEKAGARVLGLGAMNKAEFLNNGGLDLLPVLPKDRSMVVTHGNHLTAAAVVETIRQLYEKNASNGEPIYFTGASSKTGRAVALALHRHHGVPLICHASKESRRNDLASEGLEVSDTMEDGHKCKFWIIGKYDLRVCDHLPEGAIACVFAVPNPLDGKRPDVTVLEGATLHIDQSRLSKPRAFSNLLRADEIFACHSGSILLAAHPERCTTDELGVIDADVLQDYIDRAKAIGLTVPAPLLDAKDDPRIQLSSKTLPLVRQKTRTM
eukprot:TRINITY_DN331_c0_g1_i1.p1 TRINITY_DN331_c0_g1~~TRINITY_DN331_c0_g1_i1.p1  ORF type:complete len:479 (-),score=105.04 TRINITY_DN331_c0_g1_i1:311-1747(-)